MAGAVVAASAIFLPSFILMLSVLPMFERVRRLVWTTAAMKGVGPAVRGVLAVSLIQMALHALPDALAIAIFMGTLIALLAWRIGAIKLMMAGATVGVLRSRLMSLPGIR
jgi:chromate transporter